jgi:hypothetical protein
MGSLRGCKLASKVKSCDSNSVRHLKSGAGRCWNVLWDRTFL